MGRDFVFQTGQIRGDVQTVQNADGVNTRFARVHTSHGGEVDAWIHPPVEGDHLPFRDGDRVGVLYAYDDPGSAFVLFQVGASSLGEGGDRVIRARGDGDLVLRSADGQAAVTLGAEGSIELLGADTVARGNAGATAEAVQLHPRLAKEVGVLFALLTAHAAALDVLSGGVAFTEGITTALAAAGLDTVRGGDAAATLSAEAEAGGV